MTRSRALLLALLLAAPLAACRTRCCAPCETAVVVLPVVSAPSAPTVVAVAPQPVAAPKAAPALAGDSTDALWAALMAGNERYRSGGALHPRQDAAGREAVAKKQAPKVAVLACADSRVSPEVLFDQGLGDLFVVRVAGNVPNDENVASLEYAVEHLGVQLIVVLGHERCGAVKAALAGGELPGHLPTLIARIKPAVDSVPADDPQREDHAIAANARLAAESLAASEPLLSEAVHKGTLAVRAAVYDLDSGVVTAVPLGEHAK